MSTINLNDLFPVSKEGKRSALPKQQEFFDTVLQPNFPKYVAYFGGYGSGKSLILCITMIAQGVAYGGEYVIARQYMPELKRTTMKLFLELLPKNLLIVHKIADAEIHIRSASGKPAIFYFTGLDEPDKLDSLTLSGAGIDEASQVNEEAFLKLQGRLRNPLGLRKLIIVGNPKGHDWVYRYFIKQDMFIHQSQKDAYRLIIAPSTENVHLPEGYVESMLASYSKERIQRDIYGSFDSFEGQVYDEFRRDTHVIKPFKIPEEWPKYIGIDHGYRNPAAWVWIAVGPDGELYAYREFYKREWLINEIIKGKKYNKKGEVSDKGTIELCGKEKISYAVIDPSVKARRGTSGESDFDEYLRQLPRDFPLGMAKNDKTVGIDRVKSYLKINPKTNKPHLYVFDTCTNLIDEIAQYRYQELRPGQEDKRGDKEEPYKVNDHALDALRYVVMLLPEAYKPEYDPLKHLPYNSSARALYGEIQRLKKPRTKDPFGDA